jgi:hypothetical protein
MVSNIVGNTVLNALTWEGFTPHVSKQKVGAVVKRKVKKSTV